MMAWGRSGDRPSSGSMMAISLVTHTVAGLGTISWQCDRPQYDIAYVELITALSIVGYSWNSQELMAIPTRLCLQHPRWICRIFFSRGWIQMNYFVNMLGNTMYHFRSLVYNVHISRLWWPTTTMLQLWAESVNWFISRPKFYIAKHALRGNRKFKVVRLCSKLVGDSLWSSGLCMLNFRQICKKNLWCGGEATINLNAHNSTLVM